MKPEVVFSGQVLIQLSILLYSSYLHGPDHAHYDVNLYLGNGAIPALAKTLRLDFSQMLFK